eukprot:jgi/Ulvmu1/8769/UM048_0024.1
MSMTDATACRNSCFIFNISFDPTSARLGMSARWLSVSVTTGYRNCSRACAAMSGLTTTSSSTDGALPHEPPPEPTEPPLPAWGRKARATHRLRTRVSSDAVSRWSFLLTEAPAAVSDGHAASNGAQHAVTPAALTSDASDEPPAKRLAPTVDSTHVAAASASGSAGTQDVKVGPAAQASPTAVNSAAQDRPGAAHAALRAFKAEEPTAAAAALQGSVAAGGAVGHLQAQQLLQYLMQAQLLEQRPTSANGAAAAAASPQGMLPPQQACRHEVSAGSAPLRAAAGAAPVQQPPSPPAAAAEPAPEATGNGAAALSDSVASILQALQQQAAAKAGGRSVSNPPLPAAAAEPAVIAPGDTRSVTLTSATAVQGDWPQDMHSVLRQLAERAAPAHMHSAQAHGHEAALPSSESSPQTQSMPTIVLGRSAAGPASNSPPLQSQLTAFSRQHDVNQEKNKRIQEEANLLVRSGLINRPASAAVQPPPPPAQQRQQPAPQPPAPRGMQQLSSQSVLAHYNLHHQQQLAQQLQQRQQEQVAAVAQQLLQQQLRQRGLSAPSDAAHAPAHLRLSAPASGHLSESEVQFLHAAHASGTLRTMQLQQAQLPPHQTQPHYAHAAKPPQQQRHATRPQHHAPDLHSILRALQGASEHPSAAAQPQRAAGVEARVSNAERIESLRRQVSAHLRASGAADASPTAAHSPLHHQQDHRPATLSEQLMHDIAASMASGAQGAQGQHVPGSQHVAETARLLQQHAAASAMTLDSEYHGDTTGMHGGHMFHGAEMSQARPTDAVGSAAAMLMPQQNQCLMSMGSVEPQTMPAGAPPTPLQPMHVPAQLAGVSGPGPPSLSSLMADAARTEARPGVFTSALHSSPGQFPRAAGGHDGGAHAYATAGMHMGGERENQTENLRAQENPPLVGDRRCDSYMGGAECGRSAFTVTGDRPGVGENGAHAAHEADGGDRGHSADREGGAEADAGRSSSDGHGANENVQLLCKDRVVGADAQEGRLLEPAVS